MIDRKSCGYKPRNERIKKGKVNQRARRIEWEHLTNVLFSFKNMDILNMPRLTMIRRYLERPIVWLISSLNTSMSHLYINNYILAPRLSV